MAHDPESNSNGGPRPTPNRRSESDPVRPPGRRRGEGLMTYARTAAWLVPLTVLIWVYAEREQEVSDVPANKVPVSVASAVPNRFVAFAGAGQQPTLDLKLGGPHDAVEDVRRQLYAQPGLVLEVGSLGVGTGRSSVNVLSMIQNLPLFRANGVTVRDAQPAELTVDVDDVVERDATVRADPKVTNVAASVFVPPRVRLRGPRAEIADLEAAARGAGEDGLTVYADVGKIRDLTRPGERSQAVAVTLPAAAPRVTMVPPQVQATVQLRTADVSYTIPYGVTVKFTGPLDVWNGYRIDFQNNDPSLPRVEVTGPPDQVAALAAHQGPPPTASLDVRAEDVGGPQSRTLTYNLPPGVRVTADQAARQYTFTLTRRDTGGGG